MDGSERCSGSGWEDESMRQNIECVHSSLGIDNREFVICALKSRCS